MPCALSSRAQSPNYAAVNNTLKAKFAYTSIQEALDANDLPLLTTISEVLSNVRVCFISPDLSSPTLAATHHPPL